MNTRIITLLRTNFIMLTRQRGLIISSLGLAVISMLVFGFLFGGNNASKTRLGVVDQDHSSVSTQIVSQLQKSDALQVFTGGSNEEQQALRDGQRDAVIILPAGFSQQLVQGGAHMPLYYLNEAPRQVIYNGAGWSAIQTGMLVMLAWIVASMLVVWRAFKWL